MVLTNEEKRTIWIAAVGGAAVLLIYFAGLPLWNRWTALGAALKPKLELMQKLEERANAQKALLARRDALARELGAVEGRATPAGPGQGMPIGPAQGRPIGPGQGMPAGPAQGMPAGQPQGAPGGPTHGRPISAAQVGPASTAQGGPAGTIQGGPVGSAQGVTIGAAQGGSIGSTQGQPPSAPPPAAGSAQKSNLAVAASARPGAPAASPAAPPHSVAVSAYVERQAGTVGVRFNSVTPFTPTLGCRDGESLKPAGVVVTFETATPMLLRLLYALEKGDRLLRIERMEIHRDIKKGPMVTATLHIVGYEATAR